MSSKTVSIHHVTEYIIFDYIVGFNIGVGGGLVRFFNVS